MTSPVVEKSLSPFGSSPPPLGEPVGAGAGIEWAAAPGAAGAEVSWARRGAFPGGGAYRARLASRVGPRSQLLAGAVLLAIWAVLWGSFVLAVVEPPGRSQERGAGAAEVAGPRGPAMPPGSGAAGRSGRRS